MPIDNASSGSSQSSQLMSSASTPPIKTATDKSVLPTSEETNKTALPGKAKSSASDSQDLSSSSNSEASKVPTPNKPEENQQDKIGSKFAALSRKEREIQAKNQEVKDNLSRLTSEKSKLDAEISSERAKLKAESDTFAAQRKEYEEFQALKKMNGLKAMEALGFTYQQLTDIVLNDNKPTPEQLFERSKQDMKAELDAYKKELADRDSAKAKEQEESAKKALEEAQKAAENEKVEVLNNFRGEIFDFIDENRDTYELTHLNEASEIIYSVIDKHFQDTGKVMSIKEASDITETWLEQQVQRNLATKKYSAKVNSQSPKENKEVISSKSTAPVNETPRTITNNMTSAASSSYPSDNEKDRIRRALAALG